MERTPVTGRARFDMQSWLSLRSARWFLVNPGETLFLPANMTHKVITLESYIGVGGFFLALPNSLRLLSHWIVRAPLWSKYDLTGEHDNLVGEIAEFRSRFAHAPAREPRCGSAGNGATIIWSSRRRLSSRPAPSGNFAACGRIRDFAASPRSCRHPGPSP